MYLRVNPRTTQALVGPNAIYQVERTGVILHHRYRQREAICMIFLFDRTLTRTYVSRASVLAVGGHEVLVYTTNI